MSNYLTILTAFNSEPSQLKQTCLYERVVHVVFCTVFHKGFPPQVKSLLAAPTWDEIDIQWCSNGNFWHCKAELALTNWITERRQKLLWKRPFEHSFSLAIFFVFLCYNFFAIFCFIKVWLKWNISIVIFDGYYILVEKKQFANKYFYWYNFILLLLNHWESTAVWRVGGERRALIPGAKIPNFCLYIMHINWQVAPDYCFASGADLALQGPVSKQRAFRSIPTAFIFSITWYYGKV